MLSHQCFPHRWYQSRTNWTQKFHISAECTKVQKLSGMSRNSGRTLWIFRRKMMDVYEKTKKAGPTNTQNAKSCNICKCIGLKRYKSVLILWIYRLSFLPFSIDFFEASTKMWKIKYSFEVVYRHFVGGTPEYLSIT